MAVSFHAKQARSRRVPAAGRKQGKRVALLLSAALLLSLVALWVNRLALAEVYYRRIPLPELRRVADGAAEPQARMVLAERYLETGQPADAEAVLRPLLERDPDRWDAWLMRANAEFAQGKLGPAYASLQVARTGLPPSAAAHFLLGQLRERRGDETQAEANYRKAVALEPSHLEARYHLARLELSHLHYGAAIEHLQRVRASRSPRRVEALQLLAQAHHSLGELETADRLAREAVREVPTAAYAWFILGTVLKTSAQPDRRSEAGNAFRRALELDPKLTVAHHELGMLAFQAGEYETARVEFEIVLRDYPLHKQSYPVLAQCYRRLGRPAEAERVLERYAALDTMDLDTAPLEYSLWAMPDNVALRVKLARLYLKYRRPDMAAAQVALALETNPGYPDAVRLQNELRKKQ